MKRQTWIMEHTDYFLIFVYVRPKSKKNEIMGEFDHSIRIRIDSQPVKGQANKDLIKFLSKKIGCPIASIQILNGEEQTRKTIKILKKNITKKNLEDIFIVKPEQDDCPD